jgi:hypothetical protein
VLGDGYPKAFVKIWVYNEEGGTDGKGKWRYVTRTAVDSSRKPTTEPVWGESFEIRMYSGVYESRMDKYGLGAAKKDNSLAITFGDSEDGRKHGVRLLESDTFADLIMKVQKAVETLALDQKMSAAGINTTRISEYDGINISPHRNIAMAFVAPPKFSLKKEKLGEKFAERKDIMTGTEQNRRKQYEKELGDEKNWKPIGPGETLKEQMIANYNFLVKVEEGKTETVHLRIIEHSKGYQWSNPQYKKYIGNLASENKSKIVHAWAPYTPHGPAKTPGPFYYAPGECKAVAEWRKASVVPNSNKPDESMMKCTWLVPSAGAYPDGPKETFIVCDESQLLKIGAGTSNFKIEADVDIEDEKGRKTIKEERERLYKEAITFSKQKVPIRQIVQDLNRTLEEFYLIRKEEVRGLPKPKKITFENVQAKITEARELAEINETKPKNVEPVT